jgi:hypothetical protein
MVSVSQSHCGWVRVSHQISEGRRTMPSFIEHDGAVHLAGEADGGDGLMRLGRGGDGLADGDERGTPPVFGILLGPAGMRGFEGLMLTSGTGNQLPFPVDYYGPRSARAHIHPKKPHMLCLLT